MSREIKKPRSKLEDWLTDDRLFLISCWARDCTMHDLATEKLGISVKTLYEWIKKSKKFAAAIKEDREILDYKVENALLKRALGCTTTEEKILFEYPPGHRTEGIVVQREVRHKEHLPDTSAIFGWLNNRKPHEWKRNRDNALELGNEDNNVTINIFKSGQKKSEPPKESKSDEWDVVEAELEEEGYNDVD